ncbi:IclR family transcriptional regulator [Nocardioides insulae]|uniref:IclR family transcriptional regulator n=1 Tax=Nocardioides insulae TaxID=394734 RepID=UPI0004268437|nr:IclR family transcriptional regulator [Nocardioides insulae]
MLYVKREHSDHLEGLLSLDGVESAAEARRTGRVQSVDRAVALLRAVARSSGREATVAALAAQCGLNRATAWRILTTLEAEKLVVCERRTGEWSIGMGLIELAGAGGVDALIRRAHATLERLALQTGETAALAVVRSGKLTYVDEVAPPAVVAASWRGRVVPLHATSTGKALLSALPADTAGRMVGDHLHRFTSTTITDPTTLRAELDLTHSRGYGVCRGEFEPSAYGVSAPVLDAVGHPIALVSLWGPGDRLTENRFDTLGELVVEAAASLTGPA